MIIVLFSFFCLVSTIVVFTFYAMAAGKTQVSAPCGTALVVN